MRKKEVINNIVANLALQLVIIINGFIIPKIIIESFGSTINGLVTSITQFLAYITLLESGFGPVVKSLLYKPIASKNKKEIEQILKSSESFFKRISIIFILYILLLCIIFPHITNEAYDVIYTGSLIIIIGISTFAEYFFGITYKLFLQAKQKTYISSIIQVFTYISSIIAVIILAKIGAGIHVIKLISGLIFVLRPIAQNIYVKKKYNIKIGKKKEEYPIRQKWDGLAQHIAYVIHTNTDITVLTIFSSLPEVSVYSVYLLIIKGVKAIIAAISNGTEATFGDMIAKKEVETLQIRFNQYESLYYTICTMLFGCSIVLITPLVSIYTHGITDVNYVRPIFGALLVISEFIWAIRQPYNDLIKVAGHFKQTRIGAWVECITNIIISIILVQRLGIIGVAIGTIVAMTIRATEFIYHTNKYILKRSIWESIKKILLVVVETIIIVLICNLLPYRENTDYLNWGINALMTFLVAAVVVLGTNAIFFRKELSEIKTLFKSLLHRKPPKPDK
ncbi:polysaccharide biosynthesis C-terminal domain-containing protein [Candidatus Saccharibacteria bacterium]|nr:polysaccharide biosynthesis C-terminal domain-containing protein [Candidatus Saccharibacteria bacterium]